MKIDMVLVNGKIYTLTGEVYGGIAVSGNKIAALGTADEISKMGEKAPVKIDLQGKAVMPGFNDSHMHLVEYGLSAKMLDLEECKSINQLIKDGRAYIESKNLADNDWILGFGWDENDFENPIIPTKEDLDKISCNNPIMITRVCEHIAVVNSKALEVTGANVDTTVKGGSFDKDANGELTGVIRENTLDWFTDRLPYRDVNEIKEAIQTGMGELKHYGITSVHTSDLHSCVLDVMLQAYADLIKEDEMSVRVCEQLYLPSMEALDKFLAKGLKPGHGNDIFKLGPMKLLTDGCLGARTAALREAYSDDPNNYGMYTYTSEELDALVLKAHKSGMQVFLHAIGDGAIERCLNSIEKALKAYPREHRHAINHFQIAGQDLFERAAKLGIIGDIQPAFVSSDWEMAGAKVGNDRLKTSYAWKSMLGSGMKLMGSSDCPVECCNPFKGIYAAVTRKDENGNPHGGFMPEQNLSVSDAINLFTKSGAYESYDENKKGILAKGYLADLIVVSDDPFTIEHDAIKDIKVLMTIMDGKVRYKA